MRRSDGLGGEMWKRKSARVDAVNEDAKRTKWTDGVGFDNIHRDRRPQRGDHRAYGDRFRDDQGGLWDNRDRDRQFDQRDDRDSSSRTQRRPTRLDEHPPLDRGGFDRDGGGRGSWCKDMTRDAFSDGEFGRIGERRREDCYSPSEFKRGTFRRGDLLPTSRVGFDTEAGLNLGENSRRDLSCGSGSGFLGGSDRKPMGIQGGGFREGRDFNNRDHDRFYQKDGRREYDKSSGDQGGLWHNLCGFRDSNDVDRRDNRGFSSWREGHRGSLSDRGIDRLNACRDECNPLSKFASEPSRRDVLPPTDQKGGGRGSWRENLPRDNFSYEGADWLDDRGRDNRDPPSLFERRPPRRDDLSSPARGGFALGAPSWREFPLRDNFSYQGFDRLDDCQKEDRDPISISERRPLPRNNLPLIHRGVSSDIKCSTNSVKWGSGSWREDPLCDEFNNGGFDRTGDHQRDNCDPPNLWERDPYRRFEPVEQVSLDTVVGEKGLSEDIRHASGSGIGFRGEFENDERGIHDGGYRNRHSLLENLREPSPEDHSALSQANESSSLADDPNERVPSNLNRPVGTDSCPLEASRSSSIEPEPTTQMPQVREMTPSNWEPTSLTAAPDGAPRLASPTESTVASPGYIAPDIPRKRSRLLENLSEPTPEDHSALSQANEPSSLEDNPNEHVPSSSNRPVGMDSCPLEASRSSSIEPQPTTKISQVREMTPSNWEPTSLTAAPEDTLRLASPTESTTVSTAGAIAPDIRSKRRLRRRRNRGSRLRENRREPTPEDHSTLSQANEPSSLADDPNEHVPSSSNRPVGTDSCPLEASGSSSV